MHSYAGASANTVNDTEKTQITRSVFLAGPKMEIGSKICIRGEKVVWCRQLTIPDLLIGGPSPGGFYRPFPVEFPIKDYR